MNIKRFCEGAPLPERKTDGAAGYDLPACAYYDIKDSCFKNSSGDRITTNREGSILIPLGWGFEIPVGWKGDLKPRSSTNHWLIDGTIDWDIVPVLTPQLVEVPELTQTARGTGGNGSTGR